MPWPFWKEHAHYAEGRRWLELALDLGRDAPPADRLRVLTGVGTLSWYLADEAYSRQAHEQALTLAQRSGTAQPKHSSWVASRCTHQS